jgi:predicted small metal-binding protein
LQRVVTQYQTCKVRLFGPAAQRTMQHLLHQAEDTPLGQGLASEHTGSDQSTKRTRGRKENGMRKNGMRALLCGCGRRLEADEDQRLCERVVAHLERDHRTAYVNPEVVRQMVASRAYKIEYVVIYPNGSGPDEEFGLEPY